VTPEQFYQIKTEGARLMLWVNEFYPEAMRVPIDEESISKLGFFIEEKDYLTVLYVFGIDYLRAVLTIYESEQNYELCECIVDAIVNHNVCLTDNLPTDAYS
jgi:hypothetical protein